MNLVFIARGIPNPIKSAGDLRALNMLRILRAKYSITVIASSADYGVSDVKGIGCEAFLAHSVKKIIEEKKPEVIILSHWLIANRYLDEIKTYSNAKIIIDSIDLEFLRLQRTHDFKGEEVLRQSRVDHIKQQELNMYQKADKIIIASIPDQEELVKNGKFETIYFPCIYTINSQKEYCSNNNAYIICNWTHEPNYEATIFLCKEVIPYVDVKFHIVGKHTPQDIWKFSSEKVIIHGAEYELGKFLNCMSMCLAPTMYGAGINGKIGEALAFGIPVVTTPLGALAYGLEHRKTAMIAKDSKEFIDSINELMRDSLLVQSLRENGKKLMEQFSLDYWKEKFEI